MPLQPQVSRPRGRPSKLLDPGVPPIPFDEKTNRELLRKWQEEKCQKSYNQLFTNFGKIVDGVIGFFVKRGLLLEGEYPDYRQDSLLRLLTILHQFDPDRGRLYSWAYSNVSKHLQLTRWNDLRKYSKIQLEPDERTLEAMLGHKFPAPHIGIDFAKFLRRIVTEIRRQQFGWEKETNIKVKRLMFRHLLNKEESHRIRLPQFHKDVAKVRYRMLISRVLKEEFTDEYDSYYVMFQNFFH